MTIQDSGWKWTNSDMSLPQPLLLVCKGALDSFYSLYNHFELELEGVDCDVEFSDLHHVLSTEYRPNISHVEASRIIKQAFPSVTTK